MADARARALPPGETGERAEQAVARLREAEAPPRDPPAPTRPTVAQRQRRRVVLLLLGPLALLALGLHLYLAGGRIVSTDNAYVRAERIDIATDVPGFVAEVAVAENQIVEQGQLLFRLDDESYRIALAAALARLESVRNELTTLRATYREKLAELDQARTDVAFYQAQFRRQQELQARGVAAQMALDQARRDVDAARARVAVAERQAEATLAALGGSADLDPELHPRFQEARAEVDRAERDLRRTRVHAPVGGVVTHVHHLPQGAYLPAARAAFVLVATDNIWVEASPKETALTHVRVGNPATVRVDTYPGVRFAARVASISPASGAEFAVLPPQNASGNWVKVVQRIPLRLALDLPADAPKLRAGMSVVVEIDTGEERSLAGLFRDLRRWLGL
ncbi:HlyD family secretion protein [Elioraea tepidiphila]|uniref:HlyD family secretion protein n=1 Tax=Elioraea tepidiphila TaxID=457934 RepID=UPI00037E99CA|nr:HlyD family secretion protein [Elioraea tepidiphila]